MKSCVIVYSDNDLVDLSIKIQNDINSGQFGSVVSCSHSIYAPVREPKVTYQALVIWSGK